MLRRYMLGAGLALAAGAANGQTTIKGDSIYRGLQVNKTNQDQVVARLGRQYTSRELVGETLVKLRGGGCVTRRYKAGIELNYKQLGVAALATVIIYWAKW